MIARKILYTGTFNKEDISLAYDITRKIEITGEVVAKTAGQLEFRLEGDPAYIKLVQHQVERRLKGVIQEKIVERMGFQNYSGLALIN